MRGLKDYRGKTALITGASSGIGRLLALRLAGRGARLALVARRVDRLEALASEIGGDGALVLPCDVAEPAQIQAAASRALQHFGSVDLLVNNAGYGRYQAFLDWDLADIERMTRVNFLGAAHFTKALLPTMVERRRGWIVFVASLVGRIAVPHESAYVATKSAVIGFAESLSLELDNRGVQILTVCPAAIGTDFFDEQTLQRMPPVVRRTMIEPEPLVEAILRALAQGKREITFPRYLALAYAVRALAPSFLRRQVKRRTI